jgi:hypothetical protein
VKKIKSIEPTYGINWKILKGRLNFTWRIVAAILWAGTWISVVLRCYDMGPFKK